jgi:hypothetical protein
MLSTAEPLDQQSDTVFCCPPSAMMRITYQQQLEQH